MSSIFWPRPKDTIRAFLKARGIHKPYFLCVGARYGYKNYGIFWDGIKLLPKSVRDKYMVVLVGEPESFSYMDTMNLKVCSLLESTCARSIFVYFFPSLCRSEWKDSKEA